MRDRERERGRGRTESRSWAEHLLRRYAILSAVLRIRRIHLASILSLRERGKEFSVAVIAAPHRKIDSFPATAALLSDDDSAIKANFDLSRSELSSNSEARRELSRGLTRRMTKNSRQNSKYYSRLTQIRLACRKSAGCVRKTPRSTKPQTKPAKSRGS